MRINFAHLRDQGIDFAVFDADAISRSNVDRNRLLADLTARARRTGLSIQKSALAFAANGRIQFYGTPDLVRYLASGWIPQWTHSIKYRSSESDFGNLLSWRGTYSV